MIDLRPVAWMVTDERGYESLHREEALAMNYLSHVRGGIVDALVKRSAVVTVIADLSPEVQDGL